MTQALKNRKVIFPPQKQKNDQKSCQVPACFSFTIFFSEIKSKLMEDKRGRIGGAKAVSNVKGRKSVVDAASSPTTSAPFVHAVYTNCTYLESLKKKKSKSSRASWRTKEKLVNIETRCPSSPSRSVSPTNCVYIRGNSDFIFLKIDGTKTW